MTINGKPGYLLRVMEGLAVVGMEFDPLDGELIPVDTISVTNLPEPAFGKHTNYDGVELGAPNQYYLDWQYWYPYGNDTCSPNDYFKPGVPYTAYMTICPEPGYTFTYSEDMNITVNGRKLSYAAPVGAAPDQPMGLPAAPNDDVTGGFGLWPGARMVSAFLDFPALTEDDHVTVDSLAVETRGFYNVDLPYMPSETESVFSFNASFSGPVESYSDPTWYLRTGEDMIEWTDPFSAENGSNYILSFRVKLLPGCVANEDLYLYVDNQRIPHSSELEVNSFDAHFDLEYDDENDRTVVRVFLPRSLQCLVTYDPGNGEAPTRAYCPNGEAPTRPSEDPTREGLTFKGWYKDETNSYPCSFTDQIDNDITLYARWEISHAQVYLQRYPVVGKHFEAGMDACYSPTEGARIDPEYAGWYDPQNRLWLINLCPPIVEGVTFQFRVTMFLDDNVDLAESFTARIDRKNAKVTGRTDHSVSFYVEWVAEPVTVISHIDITDVVEPRAGAVATGSFTAPAGLAFDTIAGGVMWKDLETGDPLRNGQDTFQAGHRYKGSLRFCAEDDSYLLSDDLTATVNGMPARVSIEPNYNLPGSKDCYIYFEMEPAPANPFADVEVGTFYYDAVLWAVNHNPQITKGTDATHFSPSKTCTRGQVVTFLWRAVGCPEPTTTTHPFTDVDPNAFYYKAMLWAVENKITSGVSRTKFGPDRDCTRAQVVTFLWRAKGAPEPNILSHPFIDVQENSFYYKAMLWAVENNITSGVSRTKFGPDRICTRGQVVTFLFRAFS